MYHDLLNSWTQPATSNMCNITSLRVPLHQFCSYKLDQMHYWEFSCFAEYSVPSLRDIARHQVVSMTSEMGTCPMLKAKSCEVFSTRGIYVHDFVESVVKVTDSKCSGCLLHQVTQMFVLEVCSDVSFKMQNACTMMGIRVDLHVQKIGFFISVCTICLHN